MSANELAISFVGPGEVLSAGIAIPIVAIFLVALRFWLRSYQKVKLGPDDWTILIALGLRTIVLVTRHPSRPMPLDWITWLLMVPANGFIKLSAVFLYRRLFFVNRNVLRYYYESISCYLLTPDGCLSLRDNFWLRKTLHKPLEAVDIHRRMPDVLTDILVWILPIPVVCIRSLVQSLVSC
ncbi:plasma membrane Pth11 protein [Rutstroemia sp. NJR-2017a BBW]|nr:plasma membrane Pth11 protein [Rutstroemia sp. NJR-2017a BBW]